MNELPAMLMAVAMMGKMANRKRAPEKTPEEKAKIDETIAASMLVAQKAEHDRAPRAYRRRLEKMLKKQKK